MVPASLYPPDKSTLRLTMNASGELTRSLWMLENGVPRAPRLQKDMTCDTVVVGSGMTGLSTAYELALAGHKVIVIDRGPLLGGMTSRTTAHLAPVCDDGLSGLINLRGEEIARQFQKSQEAAVARIEEHVKRLSVECHFRRLEPSFSCTRHEAGRSQRIL